MASRRPSWQSRAEAAGWPVSDEAAAAAHLPRTLRDPEAERWACAAALVLPPAHPQELDAMLALVSFDDFFDSHWRDTWWAIERVRASAGGVNQITVARELARANRYGPPGVTLTDLSEAISELPTSLLGASCARIVRECADARRALAKAQNAAREAVEGTKPEGFNEEGLGWRNT